MMTSGNRVNMRKLIAIMIILIMPIALYVNRHKRKPEDCDQLVIGYSDLPAEVDIACWFSVLPRSQDE